MYSLCCPFSWLRRRRAAPQNVPSAHFLRVPSTPAIRGEDVITFVLPSARNAGPALPALSNSERYSNRNIRAPLALTDLDVRLYSHGQEVNEDVNLAKAKIGVSLQYDPYKGQLHVKVLGALNLPSRSKKVLPDPCVKVAVLPDKQWKFYTRTLRATVNPLFNQTFHFQLSLIELKDAQLALTLFDRHDFSRLVGHESTNSIICPPALRDAVSSTSEQLVSLTSRKVILGQALINLADLSQLFDGERLRRVTWCLLKEPSPGDAATNEQLRGEILLSLCYKPSSGKMIVGVNQVRNLPPVGPDKEKIVVKLLVYERGYLTLTRCSKSVRRESFLQLHEQFIVNIVPKMLHEASCQLILMSKSKIGGKKTLGTVTLGHRHFFPANNTALSAAGLDHWHDMEHRPGMEIDRWHFL